MHGFIHPSLSLSSIDERKKRCVIPFLSLIFFFVSSLSFPSTPSCRLQMYDRMDQFPDNMVLIVDEFVSELLRNGFTKNLIALLRDLCLNTNAGKDVYDEWETELRSTPSRASPVRHCSSIVHGFLSFPAYFFLCPLCAVSRPIPQICDSDPVRAVQQTRCRGG